MNNIANRTAILYAVVGYFSGEEYRGRTTLTSCWLLLTVGFQDWKCTTTAHIKLFIHQYTQVLLWRAALNILLTQPVFKIWDWPNPDAALDSFLNFMMFTWASLSNLSRSLPSDTFIAILIPQIFLQCIKPAVLHGNCNWKFHLGTDKAESSSQNDHKTQKFVPILQGCLLQIPLS